MGKVIKQIRGRKIIAGGERHRGWLPPGAAVPQSTPVQQYLLDFIIEEEGNGFLLISKTSDGEDIKDTWHPSVEKAVAQAQFQFGIKPEEWQDSAS